jgi:dATP pyrophosphohydrolase
MPRAPYNVAVYLYRPAPDVGFEYALLRRADAGFWQGVSGGGEVGETLLDAARRETVEETGRTPETPFVELDTVEPLRVTTFTGEFTWPADLYIVPQHWFGVQAPDGFELTLSHEHTAYRWCSYEEAMRLLRYDGNRTALWELDRRLSGTGPRG